MNSATGAVYPLQPKGDPDYRFAAHSMSVDHLRVEDLTVHPPFLQINDSFFLSSGWDFLSQWFLRWFHIFAVLTAHHENPLAVVR